MTTPILRLLYIILTNVSIYPRDYYFVQKGNVSVWIGLKPFAVKYGYYVMLRKEDIHNLERGYLQIRRVYCILSVTCYKREMWMYQYIIEAYLFVCVVRGGGGGSQFDPSKKCMKTCMHDI